MKHKLGATAIFTLFLFSVIGNAQSKIVVEQIQVFSTLNPTAQYWKISDNSAPLLEALDKGIFKALQLQRDSTYTTSSKNLSKASQMGRITIDWTNSREIPLHAYLEIYEVTPEFVYTNKLVTLNETQKDSIHSFWLIGCSIFNARQEKTFQKTMLMGLLPLHLLGMGYPITTTASMPNNMFQAIVKGINSISEKGDEIEYMEAKMPFAYAIDNYWMPLIHQQPRITIDTNKGFLSYPYQGIKQLLRMPPAVLNKINYKDKSTNNPFYEIVSYIKKNRSNPSINEYYQVIQNLRDVKNDIDYSVEGYIEFDNLGLNVERNQSSAIVFLPDSMHTIYQNGDSIGNFSVQENLTEKNKFYNPNIIYNGYDSTKKYSLQTEFAKQPISHHRVINGKFKNKRFTIQFNYETHLTTILLEDQIILILAGEKKPTKMIQLSNQSNVETVNFLLLLSSSEIFQYPS